MVLKLIGVTEEVKKRLDSYWESKHDTYNKIIERLLDK